MAAKSSNGKELASGLIQQLNTAMGDRGVWEEHWEDVAKYVLPSYSRSFQSHGLNTPGEKRTEFMYDATAPLALTRFAAVMESILTPRNSRWHRVSPVQRELLKIKRVAEWFDAVTDILFQYRYAPKANYASQDHEGYMSLGAFGTGALFVDALVGRDKGLRYRSIHLAEVYFFENFQGIIDTAMRRFQLTARQAMQMPQWKDTLPSAVRKAYEKNPQQKFWFLHCVKPRHDYDPERMDAKGKVFASYYVAIDGEVLLSEGGYNTFPYPISRYVVGPGELYGRSPAMLALPAIKTLNEEKKTFLRQGHRQVDPVLLAHDDGVLDSFDLTPGKVNFGGVNADGKPLVHVLPTGNIAVNDAMMTEEKATINDAFLVSLFQILTETPEMTATEVLERTREKGALLSPTAGRQQSEKLGPQIDRELDVLAEQRLLPPMPPELIEAGGQYQVEYDSPLSRMQKAEEAAGLMRTVEFALSYMNVTQDPSPLDWIDMDEAMPAAAYINAMPAKWLRSREQVDEIRRGRQQAAATQQMVDAAPAAASIVKTLQGGGRGR
jgi:hypothetical protein